MSVWVVSSHVRCGLPVGAHPTLNAEDVGLETILKVDYLSSQRFGQLCNDNSRDVTPMLCGVCFLFSVSLRHTGGQEGSAC